MKVIISTTFTFVIFFSVFSQNKPKEKEIDYHFEFNSMDYIGEYDGEVLRVEIDGKKRKTPFGHGVFKGIYKGFENFDSWIIYNGNWIDGKLNGRGTFMTLSTKKGVKPNWNEIESIFIDFSKELPKSINEYYKGIFSNNFFIGEGSLIMTSSYKYSGHVANWLPHGNGIRTKNDTLAIGSVPLITEEYEGVFTDGEFESGVIRLFGGGQLKGEFKAGMFNGEAKLTFTNKLSIKFADTFFQAESYLGKIKNNNFDAGQMSLKSGETLTGNWIDNLFTGKAKLNIAGKFWYEGDWEKGKLHGIGKKVIKDSLIIASVLILVKEYEGSFSNGEFENGTIRFAEKGELKGELKDGKFSGEGKITLQDTILIASSKYPNSIYEGTFIDGMVDKGTITLYTKERLSGSWTNLSYTGTDTLLILDTIFLANKRFESPLYIGNFVNGNLSQGVMIFNTGQRLTGDWTNLTYTGLGTIDFNQDLTYTGHFDQGNLKGKGTVYKRGTYEYNGSFLDNKTDGFGSLKFNNGWVYEGTFSGFMNNGDIKFSSVGIYKRISPKGMFMEGRDQGNKFIGEGEIELSDNSIYKGTFTLEGNKVVEGTGKNTFPNGDILMVNWDIDGYTETGRRNLGVSEHGDSLYEDGTFRNGILTGRGKKASFFGSFDIPKYTIYEGGFANGSFNGSGKIKIFLPDDDKFSYSIITGDWMNNEVKYGTIEWVIPMSETYQKKETYTGDLKGLTAHGIGKFMYLDGSIYEGKVKDGVPNGFGKFIYEDGSTYKGEVSMGLPNGKGIKTLKNNQTLSGKFINGEYQRPFSCKEVKIGDQTWMAENLIVIKFRNGDLIPEARSIKEWVNAGENKEPAFCYVNNDPNTVSQYGVLYNWYAVNDPRGLAPEGWYIPSHIEAEKLRDFLMSEIIKKQQKITQMKNDGINADNLQSELNRIFKTCRHALTCDNKSLPSLEKGAKYFLKKTDRYYRNYEGSFVEDLNESSEPGSEEGSRFWTSSYSGEQGYKLFFTEIGCLNSGDNCYLSYGYWSDSWLVLYKSSSSDKKEGYNVRCIKN
jgi:uncharacterized protein (TIGR02145 family)